MCGKTTLLRALTAQGAVMVDLYNNQEWRQSHPVLQRERALWLLGSALRHEAQAAIRAHLDQRRVVFVEGYTEAARLDSGLPEDWCRAVDAACRPADAVLFLSLEPEQCVERGAALGLAALRALQDRYELAAREQGWLRAPADHPQLAALARALLR